MKQAHKALYGNVALTRGFCSDCRSYAFVIGGLLACCDTEYDGKVKGHKQMSAARKKRKSLSKYEMQNILESQDYKCIYCDFSFGAVVWRAKPIGKAIILRVTFDHFVPFNFSLNNKATNFVAACQVCNGIKSNKVFDSIVDAKRHIQKRRKAKGYDAEEEESPDIQAMPDL
jgi:5-methylcytosine-specific restriction endonuclease McrA